MKPDTWRQISAKAIHEAFTSIRAAQPDTVTDDQVLRMVSRDHYPFGARENWPYKAWLSAVKDYRRALRLGPQEVQPGLPLFPNG